MERYKAVTTIAEAFNLAEPAIATLAKERGLEKVQKAFRLQFARFAADLHIKDTLNESDIDFIVEALTTDENYKWLKTADIAILFKRIRMNKYGKLYQAMNTGTFFECLDKYCIERNGEIEKLRDDQACGRVVHFLAEHHDAVVQKTGKNVVRTFAARGLLNYIRN